MILAALSAFATLIMAPAVYEEARAAAPDVIVIRISAMRPPVQTDFGVCQVEGMVLRVEKGTRYHVRQNVRIPVRCAKPGAQYPDGGAIWTPVANLHPDADFRIWLKDGEPALDQLEHLRG